MTNRAKALEALELLRKRAYSHAEKSNGPKEMREWIDKDADLIAAALQDAPRVDMPFPRVTLLGQKDGFVKLDVNGHRISVAFKSEPRVEVIDGLETILEEYEMCLSLNQEERAKVFKAARAYAKLQGKGER